LEKNYLLVLNDDINQEGSEYLASNSLPQIDLILETTKVKNLFGRRGGSPASSSHYFIQYINKLVCAANFNPLPASFLFICIFF